MKLYVADRHGLISSADIAHALRRAAERRRQEEEARRLREERRLEWNARRRRWLARVRAFATSSPPAGASV